MTEAIKVSITVSHSNTLSGIARSPVSKMELMDEGMTFPAVWFVEFRVKPLQNKFPLSGRL